MPERLASAPASVAFQRADAVRLDQLAAEVQGATAVVRSSLARAVDGYLLIGRCLLEARQLLVSDQAFGVWFRAQEFGFSQQWAHILRTAALHEDAVREAVTTQVVTGRVPNFRRLVREVAVSASAERAPVLTRGEGTDDAVDLRFACIVADPPWRYENTASNGAVVEQYPTLDVQEIAEIRVPAADDAHLYLWVTNTHLREGFAVLAAWGFEYKTTLTWCKPQLGLGWWFRNATEHVLFGVRGKQPTLAKDIPTWFVADRTRHSEKPACFYELVERSSRGPRLEMFARRCRLGWHAWGNELEVVSSSVA